MRISEGFALNFESCPTGLSQYICLACWTLSRNTQQVSSILVCVCWPRASAIPSHLQEESSGFPVVVFIIAIRVVRVSIFVGTVRAEIPIPIPILRRKGAKL